MRLATLVTILATVTVAAGDKDGTATFSAPKDRVYAAAMIVISKDALRIDQADKDSGFITYTKWFSKAFGVQTTVSVSMLASEDGATTTVLVATGNGGVKKKTLRAIGEELLRQKLIPASEVPPN